MRDQCDAIAILPVQSCHTNVPTTLICAVVYGKWRWSFVIKVGTFDETFAWHSASEQLEWLRRRRPWVPSESMLSTRGTWRPWLLWPAMNPAKTRNSWLPFGISTANGRVMVISDGNQSRRAIYDYTQQWRLKWGSRGATAHHEIWLPPTGAPSFLSI